jgi:hypothetical protein
MVQNFVTENYGGAGKLWIQYLKQEIVENSAEKIKGFYNDFCNLLSCKDTYDRIIQSVSMLALADYLSAVKIFGVSKIDAMESALIFGKKILEFAPTKKEINLTERAWDWTISWFAQNHYKFYKDFKGELMGECENNSVYVICQNYNNAFREQFHLEPYPVIKDFATLGRILPSSGKNQVCKRIGGVPTKCYHFKLPDEQNFEQAG